LSIYPSSAAFTRRALCVSLRACLKNYQRKKAASIDKPQSVETETETEQEQTMILDQLENAAAYYTFHPRLERGLRYLQTMDLEHLAPGRYDIASDQVFALVQEYDTKPLAEGFWEAHEKYIDIQYVVAGRENMGYAPLGSLQESERNGDLDLIKLEGQGQFVVLNQGSFVVMAPPDAHMPGMAIDGPQLVKKVVVKVLA
jgi:YhcH/YjgK/YiaL family protein